MVKQGEIKTNELNFQLNKLGLEQEINPGYAGEMNSS